MANEQVTTSDKPTNGAGSSGDVVLSARDITVEFGGKKVLDKLSLDVMRGWLATLEAAVVREERAAIDAVLHEAVPDFRGAAA